MLKQSLKSTAANVAVGLGGTAAGAGSIASLFGLSAVAHSSGAAIGTIGGSYVAGTIGTPAAVVLATVSAPALIAAGVAAAAAGGTYLAFRKIRATR